MGTIKITINGQEIAARPGQTILDVVREQKLDDIPTLCHSDELEPYGSCFLCVVEVKGRPNLVPSCATRVAPGMEVETRNERIMASRKTALELLLSNHYADCISPCKIGCPAGVDAQGYIALAGMGQTRKAVDLIREANPLPAVCGRVCVRKCEVVCRRVDVDQAVSINAVKRYVTDAPGIYDGQPECEPSRGQTIGIVGAGPAGLTAAWFLGKKGYKPVLYEAMSRSGGMLRYGIPTYRLPDDVLDREAEYICRTGAEINYGVRVGQDISLDELKKRHAALFLAVGGWAGKPMRVEGEFDTEGVVTGAEFLLKKADHPDPVTGTIVVVGGGNTAMDAARTAWRCGADKVIILYRRTKAEMPADRMEIEDCLEEGIEIMELAAPVGISSEKGKLKALKCIRMKLGEPDASGRRRPIPLEGSEFELPCQLAVSAIGQAPVLDGLRSVQGKELGISRWETIEVDTQTMKTNIEGIFAGGDAADDGPTVVIDAIRDGRRAAQAIHSYLSGEALESEPFVVTKEFWAKPGQAELGEVSESPRHAVHMIDVEERQGSFDEVATGFEPEDMAHEVDRCLSCGCVRYDDCALRLYAQEYGVDMDEFSGYVRKHKVDSRHPYIVYDPNKCVLCSRCIRTCARVLPIAALGLVGRGFRTEMRPAMNDPLVQTSCISCGNCVDACPTGALTIKYPFPGRAALATDNVATHCASCSIGCAITVKRFGDNRYFIGPSGVPGEYLCRYGRFGYERFIKRKRLTAPLVRSGSASEEVALPEAYQRIVDGMKEVVAKHGRESVAVFASPALSNEELYIASRIAREGLGTNNIGSLAALEVGKDAGILDQSFGFTASTADRSVLADADLIVCNNTSTEADHLILSVEIIQAAKKGAQLIVANSILNTSDLHLAAVSMDPMRGRASVLWNGVMQVLLEDGTLSPDKAQSMPGGDEFLASLERDLGTVSDLTGVSEESIHRAAALFGDAKRVVFVHSPDRPQDQASGDMETLANFLLLLRTAGVHADLLLPRLTANVAGLEVTGADPGFLPGRRPSIGFAGASSHEELRAMLADGRIRGAIIIGEDPMEHNRTGAYFHNVEFLAAVDWCATETTRFADVTLPGTTYLETEGTRCNFEGHLIEYSRAIPPPSGVPGWKLLAGLAEQFGVRLPSASAESLTTELTSRVREHLGELAAFYWNTGEQRAWPGKDNLVTPNVRARPRPIPPALTHGGRYKREIRAVGTERFRVH
ncbi:MAG: FAD-dependent oxidoreductase [Candidatus Eisenbacteria sp.]|nr:FAD-dependent oxidoreductase [Candidatus Eisenbacteria bacterium]